ncbi:CCDC105 [Bugula neritina]|uniref:CCDC105 n=1 Tax=Bugula neritina TaxID=10212 RepID=A0A7J7JMG1_BUGNE|nr:CCDC105 [Bugula neritina]
MMAVAMEPLTMSLEGMGLSGGSSMAPQPMNSSSIGPQKWSNSTVKTVKLSQSIVDRADRAIEIGKATDPLPTIREVVAELSNNEIKRYTREVRVVVARLRQSFLETNEEIRSLLRAKAMIEKAHEHTRKDIQLNRDSVKGREVRPQREKPRDGADDLLNAERMHLLNMKKMYEAQLKLIKQQLHILDVARKRLGAVTQERTRVMDLICNSLTPMSAQEQRRSSKEFTRSHTDTNFCRPSTPENFKVDPLGAYTPECDRALQEAKSARERGLHLRQETANVIDKCDKLRKAVNRSVNSGITQKMGETTSLKQQLDMGIGENRHATHRNQRWYDLTERAYEYSQGPIMYHDIMTHERLDRPQVRVFQRHPGTQLKEPQEIVRGGDGLLESMKATSRNIGLLNIARQRMNEDKSDKLAGINADGDVLRMRRRKADHKWGYGEARISLVPTLP